MSTRRTTVGIVDYGVGNHASVWRGLQTLGFRCRVSHDPDILKATDVLLLPGVGAFPQAMSALHHRGLVDYIQDEARRGTPLIGICLGMQLLADCSHEFGVTAGLGLVPGQVLPLRSPQWHIGWNTIEVAPEMTFLQASDGHSFYFNHSYILDTPPEYRACIARLGAPITVGVRRGNVVGFQFHPEKSQQAGRMLLQQTIEALCHE